MNLTAFVTIVGSLGLVLILVGFAFAAIRKLTGMNRSTRSRLPLEVVQRLPLGPKQGIAVVRVGRRVVAVSIGEGGIRPLLEVDDADRELVFATADHSSAAEDHAPETVAGTEPAGVNGPRWAPAVGNQRLVPPAGRTFGAALKTALRSYMSIAVVAAAAALASGLIDPSIAVAQIGVPDAEVAAGDPIARADSLLTRLAPELDLRIGDAEDGGLRLSGTVGIVIMMGLLTLLPTLLLMMTSFTRILVVLHFLRQALGTQSAPPAHLMAALALLLTGFVMAPTLSEVNSTALQPWMSGEIQQAEMLSIGAVPFREFMLDQTRERDLATFLELREDATVTSADDIPLSVVVSAFVTSELRTAFQIGFALFLPFIVIDVVVAAVLMSMGMFMLPPAMISLPFKLLLFVLVDGWSLIVQGLVTSFG